MGNVSFAEVGLWSDVVDAQPSFLAIADAEVRILDLGPAASSREGTLA